jgi:hypothetical protein
MIAPEPDETDEQYMARIKRQRLIKWFAPIGVVALVFGAIVLYTVLFVHHPKFGERCDDKTECEPGLYCLMGDSGSGTCTKYCEKPRDCPSGYACDFTELTGGVGAGGLMRACVPK